METWLNQNEKNNVKPPVPVTYPFVSKQRNFPLLESPVISYAQQMT